MAKRTFHWLPSSLEPLACASVVPPLADHPCHFSQLISRTSRVSSIPPLHRREMSVNSNIRPPNGTRLETRATHPSRGGRHGPKRFAIKWYSSRGEQFISGIYLLIGTAMSMRPEERMRKWTTISAPPRSIFNTQQSSTRINKIGSASLGIHQLLYTTPIFYYWLGSASFINVEPPGYTAFTIYCRGGIRLQYTAMIRQYKWLPSSSFETTTIVQSQSVKTCYNPLDSYPVR